MEMLPRPDGFLAYEIIPTPAGVVIEKDVMVTMPDGIKLACNVYWPEKPGKLPVIFSMTPQLQSRLLPLQDRPLRWG